jgi:hypothetical protein
MIPLFQVFIPLIMPDYAADYSLMDFYSKESNREITGLGTIVLEEIVGKI